MGRRRRRRRRRRRSGEEEEVPVSSPRVCTSRHAHHEFGKRLLAHHLRGYKTTVTGELEQKQQKKNIINGFDEWQSK
jgi:hypothetical protein